jgi:hypothetical protein
MGGLNLVEHLNVFALSYSLWKGRPMYAHIAGMPVEETALALAPIAAVALAGLLAARTRLARFVRSHLPIRHQVSSR